jgi:uncharacterized protein (TIGR02246 family)
MRIWLTLILLALACSPALAEDSTPQGPESSIKEHFKDFTAAWAKHDAKAVAAFYAPTADAVTEAGFVLAGRDVIEQALTDGFQDNLKDTTLIITFEKARFLKPDVALVDSGIQFKHGDADADKLHLISVLTKEDGKWIIQTSRIVAYKQQ